MKKKVFVISISLIVMFIIIWTFTRNKPPIQPSNPLPSNGKINVKLMPTLSWEASDPDGDTLTFDIYFGTDSNPTLVESDLSTNTYIPGSLDSNTKYYWKVVAKDRNGKETSSPVWSFTTLNNSPTKPSNPHPSDGQTDVSLAPTLSWVASDPDGDTLTFDIYFGTNSNPPLVESDLSINTYNPGMLDSKTTYYWKIVAKDGKGGKSEGPVWRFKTENNAPKQPSNPSPSDREIDVFLKPTLSWKSFDPDGDTLTFDIYFGTDSNPPLLKSNLSTNTFNPGILNSKTTYYWKIVAKDEKGGKTEGSIWSFTTGLNPLEKGDIVVISGSENIFIFDVTEPEKPLLLGSLNIGGVDRVCISGHYVYAIDLYNGLVIIDILNPKDPRKVGHFYIKGWANDIYVSGNYAYVGVDGDLIIVDVFVPSNPKLVGSLNTYFFFLMQGHNFSDDIYDIDISGNYVYVAHGRHGLLIIDISDPSNPKIVEYLNTGDTRGVYISGNYAYVADYRYGLVIVNISNPSRPILVRRWMMYTDGRKVDVSGNYAYVAAGDNGLLIVDISDRAKPKLIHQIDVFANDVDLIEK